MATELRWIASLPASALCAAEAIWIGKSFTTPNLAAALKAPAEDLHAAIDECGVERQGLLSHLVALAAGIPQWLELAEVALTKMVPREQALLQGPRVGEAIRKVVAALRAALPDLLEELDVRSGPIRNQWEARGPGLLAAVGRWVGPELLVGRADVVLVYPVLGGGGSAFARYNTVTIEAVLADPVPRLPEVVRLAWLVSQLGCDRPDFQEGLIPSIKEKRMVTFDRLESLASAALVPAVLEAAAEVELATCDLPTLELAFQSWDNRVMEKAQVSAGLLFDWWTTYRRSGSKWQVAVSALFQMSSAGAASD